MRGPRQRFRVGKAFLKVGTETRVRRPFGSGE